MLNLNQCGVTVIYASPPITRRALYPEFFFFTGNGMATN
jgi:hypothetical protein